MLRVATDENGASVKGMWWEHLFSHQHQPHTDRSRPERSTGRGNVEKQSCPCAYAPLRQEVGEAEVKDPRINLGASRRWEDRHAPAALPQVPIGQGAG
jgi:hypothetical protein